MTFSAKRAGRRAAICLGAMTATILVAVILLRAQGIVPFGDNSLATADAEIQYLDFFNFYKDVLEGKNSIGYSLTYGMGGNVIGLFAYYLVSPLNLLLYLFDSTQMHAFVNILIILKLGLSAASFAYFLQARLYDRLSALPAILLSAGYGLMQYSFSLGSNVMWLDGMIMLPLMLLGTHVSVRRRNIAALALPTAASIVLNWYTGGINCLFCILWLVFEFLLNEADPVRGLAVPDSDVPGAGTAGPAGLVTRFAGAVFRYGLGMGTGILISAALFLPAVSVLRGGKGAEFYPELYLKNVLNGNIADTVSRYMIGGISDQAGVSLYCGSLAAIGVIAFFLCGRIRIPHKILGAGLLAATLLMYYWQPLFFAFSLFKRVDSYYYRYGYIGSLVLLFMAATYLQYLLPSRNAVLEGGEHSEPLKVYECFVPLLSSLIFAALFLTVGSRPSLRTEGAAETLLFMLGAGLCASVLALTGAGGGTRIVRSAGQRAAAVIAAMALTAVTGCELGRSGALQLRDNLSYDIGSYADYVREAKEQAAALKDHDSGLYRVSQTAFREMDEETGLTACYNDALAYNYMGIGGYTSCPENDQMYLLERLGYREEGSCISIVNTSFLPADALLGIRYVFSDKALPGLLKEEGMGEYNGKTAYRNPFALPLAFVYDGQMLPKHDYQGPFLYLEEVWTALSGGKADLFRKLDVVRTQEGNTITWKMQAPEGNVCLYGNLPWDEELAGSAMLRTGGTRTGYAQWLAPSVFGIPFDERTRTAEVKLTYEDPVKLLDEEFYALDLDRLQELSDMTGAGAQQVEDLSMENGRIRCRVTAQEGERLFMTISRTKGWTVFRNGEKIDTEEFGYCFTVIPLVEGENEIVMEFRIPWLRAGAAATAAGLLLAAAYQIAVRRRKE